MSAKSQGVHATANPKERIVDENQEATNHLSNTSQEILTRVWSDQKDFMSFR